MACKGSTECGSVSCRNPTLLSPTPINHPVHLLRFFVCLVCALAVNACTFLPSSGPSGSRIVAGGKPGKEGALYTLVPVNEETIQAIAAHESNAPYLAADGRKSDQMFGRRGLEAFSALPPTSAVAVGDVVGVAIYETDSALFGPSLAAGSVAMSPMTALPPQTVDRTGEITVPFAGRIKVLGRSLNEVEQQIRDALRMKTADPQVVVTVAERKGGNLISVSGDVKSPAQIPVSLSGTRLIDGIAATGGSLSAPYDTMVTVSRGGTMRSDTLQEVYNRAEKNILLQAGDTVLLRKRALSFMAFGATGRVGNYPITVEDLSLSDAVAASGGPNDDIANPGAIFVYRQEPSSLLESLGYGGRPLSPAGTAFVVYQLDLRDAKGFFHASNFTIRDRDLIYYAASGSAGYYKFMRLVNTLIAPAISGVGVAASASVLATP